MLSGGALIMLLGVILMLAPPLSTTVLRRRGRLGWSPTFETGLVVFIVGVGAALIGAVGAVAEGAVATARWLVS